MYATPVLDLVAVTLAPLAAAVAAFLGEVELLKRFSSAAKGSVSNPNINEDEPAAAVAVVDTMGGPVAAV